MPHSLSYTAIIVATVVVVVLVLVHMCVSCHASALHVVAMAQLPLHKRLLAAGIIVVAAIAVAAVCSSGNSGNSRSVVRNRALLHALVFLFFLLSYFFYS